MARKIITQVTDDIDGTEDARAVTFAIDGLTYQVDLASKNEDKLRKALQPFIAAGRRVGAAPKAKRAGSNSMAVRAWAEAEGIPVPMRGRIPAKVQDAYNNRLTGTAP